MNRCFTPSRACLGLSLALAGLSIPSFARAQSPSPSAATPSSDLPLPKELPPLGKDRPLPVPQIKSIKTPEGLQVWLVRRPGLPKVSAVLAVRGGTAADPPGQEGTAEILAEVLKNGTARRSARLIAEDMQTIGGDLATDTSDDAIYVTASALSSGLGPMIDVLADVARNASFPTEEVSLARDNALQSLRVRESTPEFLGSKVFARAVYGDHPYHVVSATKEVIQAVRPETLRAEFLRRFRPESALLVLAGDLDLAAAQKLVFAAFAGWKGTGAAPSAVSAPPPAGARKILLTHRPNSVQSLIMVGRPALKATDPAYYPLQVANTIFGGSFGSRLVKNIREQKGYTYSPRASVSALQAGGLLKVRADVRTAVTGPTLKEIFAEMDRMGTTLPSAAELDRAKRYLGGLYLLRNQLQSAVAFTLAKNWVNGLPPGELAAFVPKVNAVTGEQIKKVGAAVYAPSTQTVVVVGDEPKISAELAAFGAVTPAAP